MRGQHREDNHLSLSAYFMTKDINWISPFDITNCSALLAQKKINSRAFRSDKTAKITFHNWPSYRQRHINETWSSQRAKGVNATNNLYRIESRIFAIVQESANNMKTNERRVKKIFHHTSTNGKNLSHILSASPQSFIILSNDPSFRDCCDVSSVEFYHKKRALRKWVNERRRENAKKSTTIVAETSSTMRGEWERKN